jgi:hypothetical protein
MAYFLGQASAPGSAARGIYPEKINGINPMAVPWTRVPAQEAGNLPREIKQQGKTSQPHDHQDFL